MAGVLLVDKPAGSTSHDVVERVRDQRGQKTGHAGTLDPFATGLLVVLLGRATRLQRYFLALPKTYRATAKLGWRSTTGDPHGELSHTGAVPKELELPTGRIRQRVPMTFLKAPPMSGVARTMCPSGFVWSTSRLTKGRGS